MLKHIIFSVLVIASFAGCSKSSSNPYACNASDYNPCSVKAPASEIQAVQDYLSSNGITGAIQHCSGLFYTIDNPGTGATPTVCSNISVTYEGRLTNGTVFDSATTPVALNLSQVILGWANGIPQIKAGGSIHLYIPPSLGYGSTARGPIPANSITIFKVSLIAVN